MKMNQIKSKTSKIQNELDAVLKKYGISSKNNARMRADGLVKFSLELMLNDALEESPETSLSNSDKGLVTAVQQGYAAPGTPVYFVSKGETFKAKVVKSNIKKYVVTMTGNSRNFTDGDRVRVPFDMCYPLNEQTA